MQVPMDETGDTDHVGVALPKLVNHGELVGRVHIWISRRERRADWLFLFGCVCIWVFVYRPTVCMYIPTHYNLRRSVFVTDIRAADFRGLSLSFPAELSRLVKYMSAHTLAICKYRSRIT